jgi:hypothetical protein
MAEAALSILDVARRAARPGVDPPTPQWASTLALWAGLPLEADDIDRLVRSTGRSRSWLESRAAGGKPMRELWARVGRRGRKSSVAGLIAVHEALYGGHEAFLMPGERGLIACISKDAAGAAVVARFAKTYLDALGFAHSPSRIGSLPIVEIPDAAFDLAIFPATQAAPRGWPIPVVVLDEFAHLPIDGGDDEYVNSDQAIISAVKPAMAQFPDARLIGISTPLGCSGVFHETVEAALGSEDPDVLAVTGPTWEWSPDVTEARTYELEKDEEVHAREYGAIPSATEGLAFVPGDVAAMFEPREEHYFAREPVMVIDAAESGDTFAWGIMSWDDPDPRRHEKPLLARDNPKALAAGICPETQIGMATSETGAPVVLPIATRQALRVHELGGYDGPTVREMGMDRVFRELAAIARSRGVKQVIGDDRAGPYIEALFARSNERAPIGTAIDFRWAPYGGGHKHEAVVLVRAWMRDRQVIVTHPESEGAQTLQRQCMRYRRYVTGGNTPFKYGHRSIKDDFACLLVTLAVSMNRAAEDHNHEPRRIAGAPTQKFQGGRYVGRSR